MADFIKKHQIILFSLVVCLASLHVAVTWKRTVAGGRMVEGAVSVAATPFMRALTGMRGYASSVWEEYVHLRGVREENEAQKGVILSLSEENERLREALIENARLKTLLAFKDEAGYSSIAARVVAFNFGEWSGTIRLDAGADKGVTEDMPVVTPEGVVGVVIRVGRSASTALLVTDPRSNVDALVRRTRVRGVAEGDGSGGLKLKYVGYHDDVQPGDAVVTAGLAGIFPKGMVIGEVERVEDGDDSFFKTIFVKPSANIHRMEEVLITSRVLAGAESE
jgi:rod shape-determining protein MreC